MYLSFLFSFERSCGALAQLGERLLCTQEVVGSIPSTSTRQSADHLREKAQGIVHSNRI